MSKTPKGYHDCTSYDRNAMEPHALDWAGQPLPYKIYAKDENQERAGVVLPDIGSLPDVSLKDVCRLKADEKQQGAPGLETISSICHLAGGLTARSRQGSGYFYFRSAPSAGALYPNELYIAAFDIQNLPCGIYHYGAHNRFLTRIRNGNFAQYLMAAIPSLGPDRAGVFFVTGIFFRSAWKYRRRAYRYLLLDGGHLAENLRLAIRAAGYGGFLHHAFDDPKIDELLGVDDSREGTLCCVSISGGKPLQPMADASLSSLPARVSAASRVSSSEIVYPEIMDIHAAAKFVTDDDAKPVSAANKPGLTASSAGFTVNISDTGPSVLDYARSVMQRRSKRNFISAAMDKNALHYLLWMLCRAAKTEIDEFPNVSACVSAGFLAGNIQGCEPGFYLLNTLNEKAGPVFAGNVIEKMASVCLDQAWLKNAAVHFIFMTDLTMLFEKWGARGYRYAMLTAGRLGHAAYLGATALGLGACGIGAFYDKEARKVLGINDASAMLYLVAVGKVRGIG
jgi:SagB-type dehydrogenase family enzyme